MEKRKLVILGAAGTCIDILDLILEINDMPAPERAGGPYEVAGFLDDNPAKSGTSIMGHPVLGPLKQAGDLVRSDCFFVNGIGSPRTFRRKAAIVDSTGIPDSRFVSLVHPTASVSRFASLGAGSVVFQNATVTAGASIGRHVVILPQTVISHDSHVGDFSCIAGGVTVSGNVSIGHSCYLGAGSCIRDGIRIGDEVMIGMGSVVIGHWEESGLVLAGNPAGPLAEGRRR